MTTSEGHRERLRRRFQSNPEQLSDTEKLELLLTYAIPRRDVAPLARDLIAHFGSLGEVITAPPEEFVAITGLGESTTTFVQLLQSILVDALETQTEMSPYKQTKPSPQLNLFELEPEIGTSISGDKAAKKQRIPKERAMRMFANDEIANSLKFMPQAANFQSLEEFKGYLNELLPYNAAETRQRRANYIIERFFTDNDIDTPLTYFAAHCSAEADLKPVIFYHTLKAEPIAAKVADELIWPALPIGLVEREQVRELILRYMPETKITSQAKILQAIYHTYALCYIGITSNQKLRFQLHQGTLESFLYVLTSEFQGPGIFTFDSLYSSRLHHWLLWDREWMRMQLYNLQDFGILSKISEIDTVRQFTLTVDQSTALRQFFEHPARSNMAIRETANGQGTGQEV